MELSVSLLEIKALRDRLAIAEQENVMLREWLSKYEVSMNSLNSSLPPSKDQNRPKANQSLRKPSGKPKGGQPGHKGNTLKMVTNPDTIVDLIPDYCNACGSSLEQVSAIPSSVLNR